MRAKVAGCLILIAIVVTVYVGSSPIMAAVEEASWGEVKAEQQIRPAGKIAHHERGDIVLKAGNEGFFDQLKGSWESRRFDDDRRKEVVRYVFEGQEGASSGQVTLYQTIIDTDESREPLVGTWSENSVDGITIDWDLEWEGTDESVWRDMKLVINEDADLLVLDYHDNSDKELRTLNRDTSAPPGLVRNWLVEFIPENVVVANGRWEVVRFKILAADDHLPKSVTLRVQGGQVHILSKVAYYGSDEVPQVNLCSPGYRLEWQSNRAVEILLNGRDEEEFFVTGCGTARATISVYAPKADIGDDEPLEDVLPVRVGG